MLFLKEHLKGNEYNWKNNAIHSFYATEPDRRLFDRLNGNQMLFIINYFGKSLGRLTLRDGQKIEDLILTQMPENTKSELSVFNWLRGVYLYYGN
ncbi:hypothetical protein FAM09_27415 [Niastella caeni]|uniref:Uncharacterized protein n=1 Tax=Niastella caeni TaxID=2569763 RepID=A0A4S8HIC9_9BACT|nr:hypothetical protein [Niastella caeni]THU32522.1 hypothetical protein FAM09_27415 [Niastella caeni]